MLCLRGWLQAQEGCIFFAFFSEARLVKRLNAKNLDIRHSMTVMGLKYMLDLTIRFFRTIIRTGVIVCFG